MKKNFVYALLSLTVVLGLFLMLAPFSKAGDDATCKRIAPTVAANPSSQTGSAGSTLSYSFSVTNNNQGGCPTVFDLVSVIPAGWSGSFSPAIGGNATTITSLNVCEGCTQNAVYSVTSSASASSGTYQLALAGVESGTSNGNVAFTNYVI